MTYDFESDEGKGAYIFEDGNSSEILARVASLDFAEKITKALNSDGTDGTDCRLCNKD